MPLAVLVVLLGIPESLPRERRSQPGMSSLLQGYGKVLGHRKALGYVLSGGITFGALFAFLSGAPFVFIEFYGIAPEHMGYIFTLNVGGVLIGGMAEQQTCHKKRCARNDVASLMLFGGALILFVLIYTNAWGGGV